VVSVPRPSPWRGARAAESGGSAGRASGKRRRGIHLSYTLAPDVAGLPVVQGGPDTGGLERHGVGSHSVATPRAVRIAPVNRRIALLDHDDPTDLRGGSGRDVPGKPLRRPAPLIRHGHSTPSNRTRVRTSLRSRAVPRGDRCALQECGLTRPRLDKALRRVSSPRNELIAVVGDLVRLQRELRPRQASGCSNRATLKEVPCSSSDRIPVGRRPQPPRWRSTLVVVASSGLGRDEGSRWHQSCGVLVNGKQDSRTRGDPETDSR
jgi:hypothetical protein